MHGKLKKEKFVIRSLVAPCYSNPSFNSSKISEATFGEQVKVLNVKGSWLNIIQEDGYEGWIKDFYGTFEKNPPQCEYIVIEKHPLPFGSRVQKINGQYKTINGDDYNFFLEPVKIGGVTSFDSLFQAALLAMIIFFGNHAAIS